MPPFQVTCAVAVYSQTSQDGGLKIDGCRKAFSVVKVLCRCQAEHQYDRLRGKGDRIWSRWPQFISICR